MDEDKSNWEILSEQLKSLGYEFVLPLKTDVLLSLILQLAKKVEDKD